jgi:hypothetical protein
MLCDQTLTGIVHGLLHEAKHEKIKLLFRYVEGHPLRKLMVRKISAIEKTANGVMDVMNGATSEGAINGFGELISVLDTIASKLPQQELLDLYEERAELLSVQERFRHLDKVLELPEDYDEEAPEDEDPGAKKHLLN